MDLSVGARTDAGKRENNEDAVLVLRPRDGALGADAVIIVADGMGGRASGEDASSTAVRTVRSTLDQLLKPGPEMPPFADALAAAIRRANSDVFELARSKPGQKGMGTTCVAAIIANDCATIAHVGDSRAYLLRDGLLRRLTEDHSYIHDQVRSGNLSDHDARNSRFRHVITRAIGIDATVEPDILTYKLIDGDSLLICTDGLSNTVDEAGMIQIMSRAQSAQEAVDTLVDAAKRSGSNDNITGALARIGARDPGAAESCELAQGSINPAPPAASAQSRRRFASRTRWRARVKASPPAVKAGAGGVLIGALATVAALWGCGFLSPRHAVPARPPSPAPVDVEHLSYAQPQILLYQDVAPGAVSGSDSGVVVADPKTGKLVSIDGTGRVRPAGQTDKSIASVSSPLYLAVDDQGYLYVSIPQSGLIKRYGPDGRFERTIAQGQLEKPQAIYVSRSEDIYVVDGKRLKLIRAIPGGAASSASPAKNAPSGSATP